MCVPRSDHVAATPMEPRAMEASVFVDSDPQRMLAMRTQLQEELNELRRQTEPKPTATKEELDALHWLVDMDQMTTKEEPLDFDWSEIRMDVALPKEMPTQKDVASSKSKKAPIQKTIEKRKRRIRPRSQKPIRLSDYAQKGQFLIRYSDYIRQDDRIWCVEDHILIRCWVRIPNYESGNTYKLCYKQTERYMGWFPDQTTSYHLVPLHESHMITQSHMEIANPFVIAKFDEMAAASPVKQESVQPMTVASPVKKEVVEVAIELGTDSGSAEEWIEVSAVY
ncbi:hypothetical protein L596_001104 [Steinernema carpocapsae]|uniref:Uncharacterized protein n=1 Tax=Steinernema carpocapsae TaxID=34508 RepID=A0A4U8ULB0_STECR|nr:hypothetical protein L596_001104 [Steinernema carpocapsae]